MSEPQEQPTAPAAGAKEEEQTKETELKALEAEMEAKKEAILAKYKGESEVTPWEVSGRIDFQKLIKKFGCQAITPDMLQKVEEVTGRKPHRYLRRSIFFAHREFNKMLDVAAKAKAEGKSSGGFYLYTGRGPSSGSLHLGHLVPFLFTQYLQEAFNVPLVIQMTDDEKMLFRGISPKEVQVMTRENVKDIIACGFRKDRTFIFSDLSYIGKLYPTVVRIQSKITASTARGTFGFKPEDNVGKWGFVGVQAAPSFSCCFPHMFDPKKEIPCLIPQAIDQDPYFRLTRDAAQSLKLRKPAQIHASFFPPLQGAGGKMSSSNENSAIYLDDTEKNIKKKINGHAFTKSGSVMGEQRAMGGDPEEDVPCQWLKFIMEDDEKLERIYREYRNGQITASDVKGYLIDEVVELLKVVQKRRAEITDAEVDEWMAVRDMQALCDPNYQAPKEA